MHIYWYDNELILEIDKDDDVEAVPEIGQALDKMRIDTEDMGDGWELNLTSFLPRRWEICSFCQGEGKSSAYLGAITASDRRQNWTEEEFEDYMNGAYDKPCSECKGTGKVKNVNYDALSEPMQKLIDKADEAAYYEARERESEMRFGY